MYYECNLWGRDEKMINRLFGKWMFQENKTWRLIFHPTSNRSRNFDVNFSTLSASNKNHWNFDVKSTLKLSTGWIYFNFLWIYQFEKIIIKQTRCHTCPFCFVIYLFWKKSHINLPPPYHALYSGMWDCGGGCGFNVRCGCVNVFVRRCKYTKHE